MAVVASAGAERGAKEQVRALGFSTYMPTHRLQIVHRGRKRWEERLLLGRYFFARFDACLPWRGIPSLRSVSALFMAEPPADWPPDTPAPVCPALIADEEIERFRSREDRDGHVRLEGNAGLQFVRDQHVRASTGVWAGFDGTYDSFKRGVDAAYLEVFGRKTRIEFAPGVLVAA